MKWALTHPHGADCAVTNHRHPLNAKVIPIIGETAEVSREKRLSIYGNGYFGRIIEVLGDNFSSVKNAAGEDPFEEMAHSYLEKHPSTFKSVDDIGAELPNFLKRHPLSKKFPFLPELAAIDWAAHRSFYADDYPTLDPMKLKHISEETWKNATFEFDPSVRLMTFEWPLIELWRSDGKWSARKLRALKKEKIWAMIFRTPEKNVRLRALEPAQFYFLAQLNRVLPFHKALLHLSKKYPFDQSPPAIGEWFQRWTRDGLFKKIEFNTRGKK
jgi:hypothetical protein